MTSPAVEAVAASGIAHRVVEHGPVGSLAEAAAAQGVEVADVVKTIVVRLGSKATQASSVERQSAGGGAGDYRFVLVPGGRVISWPKLRALLGVARMSMPDAATAKAATGYERGTITPFGATTAWPVIADERIRGREISLGAGRFGIALALPANAVIEVLNATVADISEPG